MKLWGSEFEGSVIAIGCAGNGSAARNAIPAGNFP
jgi:hypothetical protein